MLNVACAAAMCLTSCAKKNATVERVGILPANLLISDPSSEWLKAAVPIVLQYDLMTAHTLIPGFAPDEAGATQGGATRILRTTVESRQGGLHIEATLLDTATSKVVKVESSDASSASIILPALNKLATKLDSDAIAFSTQSTPAWQAFSTAEGSNNPQQRAQFFNQAISHDPNFGYAWVSLMNLIVPNRQTNLKNMIDEGKSHRGTFSPYDRAKFDIALDRLSNAAPAERIRAAQAALALAPNDLEVIMTLGNYQILGGDAAAGEQALRRAVSLNPANISLKFELARGLMQLRKFKEADSILTSIDKQPSVLPELATCVLLEGDKPRASAIFEKFVSSVQSEEFKPMLRASWDVILGERQKGIDLALSTKFTTPNIQALALSQATIWQLMSGDFANAQKTVVLLGKMSSQANALASVADLLADNKSTPEAWLQKVQGAGMPDPVKGLVLAYGYFLHGNYAEAAKQWHQIDNASHGTDLHARVMLASSLDHLGKKSTGLVILPFSS